MVDSDELILEELRSTRKITADALEAMREMVQQSQSARFDPMKWGAAVLPIVIAAAAFAVYLIGGINQAEQADRDISALTERVSTLEKRTDVDLRDRLTRLETLMQQLMETTQDLAKSTRVITDRVTSIEASRNAER